jgi:phosphoglycolate phosphatase-like HAD superfamily hydrolase
MKLILFDIDGTLVWTRGAGRAGMIAALTEMFADERHDPAATGHAVGLADRLTKRLGTHKFGGKTDWLTLMELLSDEGFTSDEVARHIPIFAEAMGRGIDGVIGEYDVQPCTGGIDLIDLLRGRDDVVLGLVTGNVHTSAPIKLRAAGYDPLHFPVGAYGDDHIDRDHLPALAVQRASIYYRRIFPTNDVIVIGDTLADISCARAAGAVAVAVCTGASTKDELTAAQPDVLLDDLTSFINQVL